MIVMLKSKALGQTQKTNEEILEKTITNLFYTFARFFKK